MDAYNRQRRKFSRSLAGLLGAPLVSLYSSPLRPESKLRFNLAQVHHQAAQRAKELSAGEKIQLSILLPNGSAANVKPVAQAFTQLTGITFNFIETPVDDINTRMFLDAQTSQGSYDIALPATFGIPDLAEAGAIASLDTYSNRYEPTDFQENSLYTIGDYYRGRHYGYQTDGDTYLMFYNRPLLHNIGLSKAFADKHGYALKVPETWEELDAMMAHFHNPDKGIYGGALFRTPAYMLWEWWIRFHAKGFFPLDEYLSPQINNDAGIAALEELIQVTKYLSPNVHSNGLFNNWKEFGNGNTFCNIGWGGTQKYLNSNNSALRGKLEFGPTPGGIVDGQLIKTSYFNWGWNYTVAQHSMHKELAYLFSLFACSPVISTLAVAEQDGYFDPFRVEHYADKRINETYSAEFLAEHRNSMKNSIPDLYLNGQTQYYDALRHNIKEAFDGKLSPARALEDAAKVWRRLNFKLNKKVQQEQWLFLRGRYPVAIRDRLS